jgi:hypothetical protein
MALDIKAVRAVCDTSQSTIDFTDTGFGTPKAALFVAGTGASDATAAAHNIMSIGAVDGTNERVAAWHDEDAQVAADTRRRATNDECVMWVAHNGAIEGECNWNSWITDGVRLTVGDNPPANRYIHAILFGGSDITNVKVGDFTASATEDATVDVDVGFTPDLVFFFSSMNPFDDSNGYNTKASIGWAINDSGNPQIACGYRSKESEADPRVHQRFDTNRIAVSGYYTVGGTDDRSYELTDWLSNGTNGFEVTTREASKGLDIGYLAIKFSANVSMDVGNYTMPTSIGDDPIAGVGFQPDVVFLLGSIITSTGSWVSGATHGLSVVDGTDDYSFYGSGEDGNTDSNTQTLSDDQAIHIPSDDGTDEIKATHVSMDAGGFTLNYSDVFGSACYCGYLALAVGAALALEQEGFRFRNDDGSESAATWRQNQDVQDSVQPGGKARVRFVVNATGDPTSKQFQIEGRVKDTGSWRKLEPPS